MKGQYSAARFNQLLSFQGDGMQYFPIFLDLNDQDCLVIGGGEIAARKAASLVKAGARVLTVCPDVSSEMQELIDAGTVTHAKRLFQDEDVEGRILIIAATDRREVNQHVTELAHARSIPINVVDKPEDCTFIVPSVIDRSPVQVAISTGGASPVLARLLKAQLEAFIPAAYGRLASLVESYRERVKQDLGPLWEFLPQGSLEHDPNAYLKKQTASKGIVQLQSNAPQNL